MIGGMRDKNVPSANLTGPVNTINYALKEERWLLGGQISATAAKIIQYTAITDEIPLAFRVMFQAVGGSGSTATLDLLDDGVSVLSGTINIATAAADTLYSATIPATARIDAGSKVTVTLTITGGSNTYTNTTVQYQWRPPYGEEVFS